MKQTLLTLILFLATLLAGAQVIEETAPQPAQPKAPTYNSSLLLDVDVDCRVFVDGKQMEDVKAGTFLPIQLNSGQHILQLKVEDDYQLHKQIVELEKGKQFIVSLSLKSAYNELQKQIEEEKEEKLWLECIAKGDKEAYQEYLNDYPDGKNSLQAQDFLKKIIDIEKENSVWDETLVENNYESFRLFMKNYPDSDHYHLASTKAEQCLWEKANTNMDIELLYRYFQEYPLGIYIDEVAETIIKWIQEKTGIKMVFVKGDTLLIGKRICGSDTIDYPDLFIKSYLISKYEVTLYDFNKFVKQSNYKQSSVYPPFFYHSVDIEMEDFRNIEDNMWNRDVNGKRHSAAEYNHPVIWATRQDANKYCTWLKDKTDMNFRIPSEAEWEFAAMGGIYRNKDTPSIFSGSDNPDSVAWFVENSGNKHISGDIDSKTLKKNNCRTHAVGLKKPNVLGIFDMSGNVYEFTSSTTEDNYKYPCLFKIIDKRIKEKFGEGLTNYGIIKGGCAYSCRYKCEISTRTEDGIYLVTTHYGNISTKPFAGIRLVID